MCSVPCRFLICTIYLWVVVYLFLAFLCCSSTSCKIEVYMHSTVLFPLYDFFFTSYLFICDFSRDGCGVKSIESLYYMVEEHKFSHVDSRHQLQPRKHNWFGTMIPVHKWRRSVTWRRHFTHIAHSVPAFPLSHDMRHIDTMTRDSGHLRRTTRITKT